MDEYRCIAQTSLPLRVIPAMRAAYDEIIRPSYDGDLVDGKTMLSIIKERKLVESYPYDSPTGTLHYMNPPPEFPCRIGTYDEDGLLTIELVPGGTRVAEVERRLDIDYTREQVVWIRMRMTGTSLQTLHIERKTPLTPRSVFPNALHNIITVGYRVPRGRYILCTNMSTQDTRSSPGPPVLILPDRSDEAVDLRRVVASILSRYTTDRIRPRDVSASETYIPMDETEPVRAEFLVRFRYSLNHAANTIRFNGSSPSDMMEDVKARALYVQTWQRMERHTTDLGVIKTEHQITSPANTAKYMVGTQDDGRLTLSYYIKKGPARAQHVAICSAVEFMSHITSPSTVYDTETCICDRLGIFSGTYNMFETMENSIPSHIDWVTQPDESKRVRDDQTLYQYQRDGVDAMIRHESMPDGLVGLYNARVSGVPGQPGIFRDHLNRYMYIETGFEPMPGMLCDDTGMGKTRQICSLIRHTRHRDRGATLIIVPPSIVYQWTAEIKATWPDVRLLVLYGRSRQGVVLERDVPQSDIAITTYSTCTKYMDDLTSVDWSRVVFDESHTIPRAIAAAPLRRRYTWFVTATPEVQLARTVYMIAGSIHPAIRQASDPFRHCDPTFKESRDRAWRLLRPVVIRRTRERYLDIPDVIRRDVHIQLTTRDTERYASVMDSIRTAGPGRYYNTLMSMNAIRALQHVASTGREPITQFQPVDRQDTWFHPESRVPVAEVPSETDCPICIGPMDEPAKTVCNHWFCKECIGNAMIRNNRCPMCRATVDPGTIFVAEDPATATDQAPEPSPEPEPDMPSAKMATVAMNVEKALREDASDRVLVFFETRAMLNEYSTYLTSRGIQHTAIHGGVSVSTRSRRISEFQYRHDSPNRVMLLTTKTASAGITLTRANHIMLVTPVIPRELETQMIGRAHRLGQTKPVNFTRYIASETIEAPLSQSDMTARDSSSFVMHHILYTQ